MQAKAKREAMRDKERQRQKEEIEQLKRYYRIIIITI